MRSITSCGVRAFTVILLFSLGVFAKQQTTTTVTSSLNPSTSGQSVTFTATVTSQQSGQPNQHSPDGTVQFTIDGANFGSPAALSACDGASTSCANITGSLAAGTHSVVAVYSGDTDFEGSTSQTFTQTVNPAGPVSTTTVLVSSPNPSVVGQPVTITATVSPAQFGAGTPSGTVTFSNGATQLFIGKLNSGGWVDFTTSSLPAGSDAITAVYTSDTTTFSGSTGTLTQTVNAAAATIIPASTARCAASDRGLVV